MVWAPASLTLLPTLGLLACSSEVVEVAPSATAQAASVTLPASATSAPPIVMPGCDRAERIDTICGPAVRCVASNLIRVEPPADTIDTCGPRLTETWRELAAEVESPFAGAVRELPRFDEPATCMLALDSARFAALGAVTGKLRERGRSLAAKLDEPDERALWTKEMASFELGDNRVSCLGGEPARFLLRVSADSFGPSGAPYWAVWSVSAAAPTDVRALYESSAPTPQAWPVGDLNGDHNPELVVRTESPAGSQLIDCARPGLTPLSAGVPNVGVFGVALPSGPALVVGDRLVHYDAGAIVDAPAGAKNELAVVRAERRVRAETALAMLRETLPALEPARLESCGDRARLGWAVAFARERSRARIPELGSQRDLARELSDAAELVNVRHCFEPVRP